MPIIRGGIMLKVRRLYSPRAWRRWMPWLARSNPQPTRWALWKVATADVCLQATTPSSLKKTKNVSKQTTCISRAGTTDSTGAFPVKERLPKDIIIRTATVITHPAPFIQDFIIPVIITLRVIPFGRGTMVHVTFPMSITGTVITPPGTVGTGTATSMVSGAEVMAADIKAGTEDAVEEAAEADVPGVAAVVEAVKVASAVDIKIDYSNKRI